MIHQSASAQSSSRSEISRPQDAPHQHSPEPGQAPIIIDKGLTKDRGEDRTPRASVPNAQRAASSQGSVAVLFSGAYSVPPVNDSDPEWRSLRSRATAYALAGIPVHFRGRAGVGKTTLALQIAAELGRPVTLIVGDSDMASTDLVGREIGSETTNVHDRYVQRVTRSETRTHATWADGPLTVAIREGHTLIYDEFTRSPAHTNNVLLSVLEERLLAVASPVLETRVIGAHPEFRAILTSNPEDYAGVVRAPDALLDRMITLEINDCDFESAVDLIVEKTQITPQCAYIIVRLMRSLSTGLANENPPSVRTAIMVARLMQRMSIKASALEERFVQICLDVLQSRTARARSDVERAAYAKALRRQIITACVPDGAGSDNRQGVVAK